MDTPWSLSPSPHSRPSSPQKKKDGEQHEIWKETERRSSEAVNGRDATTPLWHCKQCNCDLHKQCPFTFMGARPCDRWQPPQAFDLLPLCPAASC
ncbi:hypothetical protein BRADI_2g04365v3 [Brachypodium distachyon]|uniref:Uncharacterized protein n=1 Tax=Brachypodium distachyon TaxID=15368 RepID=A0A0Q3QN51_BRADI|nr:hypothetical protein BRADI_2g04365v3 [Brachypodium distachyon]